MSKPEHVQELESGGHVCMHCGGRVSPEGYSEGGEVEPMLEGVTDEKPQQLASTERMRQGAGAPPSFAEAVARRKS